MQVDIYTETNKGTQVRIVRKYGFLIATEFKGDTVIREGYGSADATYHQAILMAITEALNCLTRGVDIKLHTKDRHVAAKIPELPAMARAGFLDSKKKEISNAAEWKALNDAIVRFNHKITVEVGEHDYTNCMLEKMAKL